ncbi:MAG: hypothetical protein ABSA75_11165 [Candidatus Bathyarchaeia archaeon]|jgi:hypothetical protein
MKETLDLKSRKELEDKILALFGENMQVLSKEFQMLLADDLVTAFESRLKVLNHGQFPMDPIVETASAIEDQLIKA